MLHIGYTTPYRITLLLLIRRLCTYDYPEDLISTFVIFITKSILNENSVRETCSEPRLNQVFNEIIKFKDNDIAMQPTITSIKQELESINSPGAFDEFMTSLTEIIDDDEETERHETVVLEKCSVMGLFIRKCRVEYAYISIDQLADIIEAYNEYIHDRFGDSHFLTGGQPSHSKGWVSVYNIKEFLKSEAEKIELTGTSNIHPTVLHNYLQDIEIEVPHLSNIRQVRYLNYIRTREYIQSLSNLHLFFDFSLGEGVGVQYALLNIGILEFKFGHLFNALSALNDALSAARSNKDEYCLQEVQYWIEICRKNQPFSNNSSYNDHYLGNMKTLTRSRDMLRQGASSRYVFESLYKGAINIIMKDIKNMNRVQYLVTSLAWQRYGNSALAASYLKLAESSGDQAVQDIEKTVISHANMLQSLGDSDKALQILEQFTEEHPTECDFLMDWKQAQARIKRQSNKKRKIDMMEHQADVLQFSAPPYSEDYFNTIHDNAEELMLKMEYGKALFVLEEVHDFIRKTDQTPQLGYNLILKAVVNLKINEIQAAIPIAIEAMSLSKRSYDAKNYYRATIILAEAYVRTDDKALIEKSIFMLESIFPKVLLVKSKQLTSELYLTYAEALDASSSTENRLLEYVILAEEGFRDLGCKNQLLRTLFFKTMVLQKMELSHKTIKTMQEIRNIQSGPF